MYSSVYFANSCHPVFLDFPAAVRVQFSFEQEAISLFFLKKDIHPVPKYYPGCLRLSRAIMKKKKRPQILGLLSNFHRFTRSP